MGGEDGAIRGGRDRGRIALPKGISLRGSARLKGTWVMSERNWLSRVGAVEEGVGYGEVG